ncbi:MAG: peptidylglycine alpha-amidating monooxygenase [Myxococcota bacterium]
MERGWSGATPGWWLLLAASALGLACGSDDGRTTAGTGAAGGTGGGGATGGGGGGVAVTSDIPCSVFDTLASKCLGCHGTEPSFGAPVPLVTREHLAADARTGEGTVAEFSLTRMRGELGSLMPPPPVEPATAEELVALEAWIAEGYPARPEGQRCEGDGVGGGRGGGLDCEPDIALEGEEPFEMPATSLDEQVCFGIDVPTGDVKRHITTIAPRIDNTEIIHHILLLQAPTAVSPEPEPCSFVDPAWKLLYAWGPGTPPHALPDAAGFPMEANETTHFVLQVHYNNLNGLQGETDQSGIDLCTTTDLRTHDADIMAFGSTNFSGILPMARTRLDCEIALPSALDSLLPLNIFQAWPHMHTVGQELYGWIDGPSGERRMVDVPNYDFEYQITYPTEVQLQPGDTVHTQCVWNNNTPIQRSFGEGTNDEMCFNFVSYYPRIELSAWNWIAPSLGANCSMTNL